MHISLLIEDYVERQSDRERETERDRERWRVRDSKQERERDIERCEMVKTQKWYYLCNIRCAYLPINRRLQRERVRDR